MEFFLLNASVLDESHAGRMNLESESYETSGRRSTPASSCRIRRNSERIGESTGLVGLLLEFRMPSKDYCQLSPGLGLALSVAFCEGPGYWDGMRLTKTSAPLCQAGTPILQLPENSKSSPH